MICHVCSIHFYLKPALLQHILQMFLPLHILLMFLTLLLLAYSKSRLICSLLCCDWRAPVPSPAWTLTFPTTRPPNQIMPDKVDCGRCAGNCELLCSSCCLFLYVKSKALMLIWMSSRRISVADRVMCSL
jgi:hypothetical protein